MKKVLITIVTLLLIFSGCEWGTAITIIIENHTDQKLVVYYEDSTNTLHCLGAVGPGEQTTFNTDAAVGYYPIVAKNDSGEIVFSEVFSFTTNLEKIDRGNYRGVIPPLGLGGGSSDNTTENSDNLTVK